MSLQNLRIRIATKNEYLRRKLELELDSDEFSIVDSAEDVLLLDIDTEKRKDGAILMSYGESADISLPFRLGEVKAMLLSNPHSPISLNESERTVSLFGEKIKLTELEFSLFSLLFYRKDFVSREEILKTVWRGEADSGIINVYVHYLREKLEKGGEKIILSSRKLGYGINKKFLAVPEVQFD